MYVIWSNEMGAWYAAGGYTMHVEEAARYEWDVARGIVDEVIPPGTPPRERMSHLHGKLIETSSLVILSAPETLVDD